MDEKITGLIAQMRGGLEAKMQALGTTGEAIEIPARSGARHALIYRPKDAQGPLPVYFDVHGGGFIYGSPEVDNDINQWVCDELGIVVISPSYRLAPESQYPSDKEDVYDVVKYVHDHAEEYGIDPDNMAIGGASAGGNIATVISMMAKDRGDFALKCTVMFYPTVDLKTDAHAKETPEGCIPPDLAAVFDLCYRAPERAGEIYCSPLYATAEELAGLPPHIIVTAEGDSLRGEAEEYAKHLMAAGVEVTGRRFMAVGHGFNIARFGMGAIGDPEVAARAVEEANQMLLDGLRKHLL